MTGKPEASGILPGILPPWRPADEVRKARDERSEYLWSQTLSLAKLSREDLIRLLQNRTEQANRYALRVSELEQGLLAMRDNFASDSFAGEHPRDPQNRRFVEKNQYGPKLGRCSRCGIEVELMCTVCVSELDPHGVMGDE